jgi:hypothetical protein
MASKLIILDTEVFVRVKCDFSHSQLKKLSDLPKSELYCLAITDVTDREIESKVVDQVEVYFNEALKLQKNVLSHSAFGLFDLNKDNLEFNNAIESALKQYHLFKLDMNIEVISTNDVKTTDVMHLYFNLLPPFSFKKKNEFPDAISLLAIKEKIKNNECIVISGDKDWASYFEKIGNFEFFSSISEFIDKLLTDEDKILSEFKNQLTLEVENIKDHILQAISNGTLTLYLNAQPVHVYKENIKNLNINSFNIVNVEKRPIGAKKTMSEKVCDVDFSLSLDTEFRIQKTYNNQRQKNSYGSEFQSFQLDTVAGLLFTVEEYKGKLVLIGYSLNTLSKTTWYISNANLIE